MTNYYYICRKQLINLIKKKQMKKTLLIGAVLMSGVTGFAQNNRQAASHFNKTINMRSRRQNGT